MLRSPPTADVIQVDNLTQQGIQAFVLETLDALKVTTEQVLATALSQSERASRIGALHSQAGARVAAFAAALSATKVQSAVHTYKAADLKIPEPPTQSTLNGELDRRAFMSGMEQAAAFLTDRTLASMKDPGSFKTATSAILAAFGEVGQQLAQWAASMPAGVVGVLQATENSATRSSDDDVAREAITLLRGLLGERPSTTPSSSEKTAMLTITMLASLADQDPSGFWDVVTKSFDGLDAASQLAISKKFEWGDTGVTPHDPAALLAEIPGIMGDTPILGMIASAVSGIDIARAAQDNVQVVSMRSAPTVEAKRQAAISLEATLRTGFANAVAKEIEANPTGALALEVKKLVAPDVAQSVKSGIQHVLRSLSNAGGPEGPNGQWDFNTGLTDDDIQSTLKAASPQDHNR